MLSDGSLARKTNDVKELVLLRIEKEDVSVYLVTSLLEMGDFGGTDAHSLKNALLRRHAQDILGLSWNCLVSIRHSSDIFNTTSCR